MTALLPQALAYAERGFAVLPIKVGTKQPSCGRWGRFREHPPSDHQLRRWFRSSSVTGIAVLCGAVSDNLVIRDFDSDVAYGRWAEEFPGLAGELPTVRTARGHHVYCRANHDKITELDDGEVRGDGICLLPRSRHPSGVIYEWETPLPPGRLPFIQDVAGAGFLRTYSPCNRESREDRGVQKTTEDVGGGGSDDRASEGVDADLATLVLTSLPSGPGRRNRAVFELARTLKSVPRLCDAVDVGSLEPLVRWWHSKALPFIRTKPWEETWIDFIHAWPKVKFPKGGEPMVEILNRAMHAEIPERALRYDQEQLRRLAALCRELQDVSGKQPFFLACRTAGRLLGGVDYSTAWRWLFLLTHDRLLEVVEPGKPGGKRATRYRWIGGK